MSGSVAGFGLRRLADADSAGVLRRQMNDSLSLPPQRSSSVIAVPADEGPSLTLAQTKKFQSKTDIVSGFARFLQGRRDAHGQLLTRCVLVTNVAGMMSKVGRRTVRACCMVRGARLLAEFLFRHCDTGD